MGEVEGHKKELKYLTGANFKISAYMQNLMCYTGTELVFTDASVMIEKMKGVSVTAKQIERVCHCYGERIEESQQQAIEAGCVQSRILGTEEKEVPHYAMLDGAMLLTREEKWKEIKLGRIFKAQDNITINHRRNEIVHSQYVAHLGNHTDFLEKFEYALEGIKKLTFVADGAPWIWNWVESSYPNSTQILDFFHAKEHLHGFADVYFRNKEEKENWTNQQSLLLLNDRVEQVIKNIEELPKIKKKSEEKKRKILIKYYQTNRKRMMYKTFKNNGLMIGSGPIEAAHRNVIQQRLKRSGQRWTRKGLQQVANLRAELKSNNWNKVLDFITLAA